MSEAGEPRRPPVHIALEVDEAIASALQQLKVINGNLSVSRAQQADWQVQEALLSSKLKTRKRAPGSVSSEGSHEAEVKRPRSAAGLSLRSKFQHPAAEALEPEDATGEHRGASLVAAGAELANEVERLHSELEVAASAQRSLQERLHDLEVLNEELVIAKNAMLSDLMVDDDVQSLREERARLKSALEKRDARVLQLEENLAQVKEERNHLQRMADELLDRDSPHGSARASSTSPSKHSSLSTFRHALDDGAHRLKSAVYDELHSGSGGAIKAQGGRPGLTGDKEASYQQRIIDLENQCAGALAQLRKQRLTHDRIETLGTQLVDLHGELDTLQRVLTDAHADPLSVVPPPVLAAALAAELSPRSEDHSRAAPPTRPTPVRGSLYVTHQ